MDHVKTLEWFICSNKYWKFDWQSSSASQSTENTNNNDSENIAPSSDEGTGSALESASNFEKSNYSHEATERRSKLRNYWKKGLKSWIQNLALRLKCWNATKPIYMSKEKWLKMWKLRNKVSKSLFPKWTKLLKK